MKRWGEMISAPVTSASIAAALAAAAVAAATLAAAAITAAALATPAITLPSTTQPTQPFTATASPSAGRLHKPNCTQLQTVGASRRRLVLGWWLYKLYGHQLQLGCHLE